MMYNIKCEKLKGVKREDVAEVMRNKYPLMKIISKRYEVNFLDLAKIDRVPSERIMNVYFIDDVDHMVDEFDKEEEKELNLENEDWRMKND